MPFKQAFRLAFVTLIWKQYKGIIVSTILLFLFLYLVGSIHADYLANAKLNGDTSGVGVSFIYKWLSLATGVSGYFAYHYWRSKKGRSKKQREQNRQQKLVQELDQLSERDDPFSNIRARKKLRSRADFIIDKDTE